MSEHLSYVPCIAILGTGKLKKNSTETDPGLDMATS